MAAEKLDFDKLVEQWRKEYGTGSIVILKVEVSKEDTAVGYFVNPAKAKEKFSLFSRTMTLASQQKKLDAGFVALNHCWLGGDERYKDINDMVAITGALEMYGHLTFLSASSETT